MIELLNQFGGEWAIYFGAAVLQNTIFLGLILLVLNRLKNASARVRYMVGMIGLAKLLLPPLLRVPQLISAGGSLQSMPVSLAPVTFMPLPVGAGAPVGADVSLGATGILAILWAACTVAYLTVSIVRTVRLTLVLRDATPLHETIASAGGGERGVRLYRSDRISMPLTLGLFPRKIFVPREWDRWSGECRRMIIRHEMAHISRRDGLFQVFQIAAQALYWFHPLVWFLNRRLREFREMACDDASIGNGKNSSVAYSRYLVEIAESMIRNPVPCESASALIRQRNELLTRVRYQMKGGAIMRLTRTRAALVFVGLVFLILPLSWYFAGAASDESGAGVSRAVLARSGPAAEGPGSTRAHARGETGEKFIEIRVAGDGGVKVNGEATDLDDMENVLERVAGGSGDAPVIKLVCDPDVTMGTIYRLQDVLRGLDLMKMFYLTAEGEGLPLMLPPFGIEKKMEDIPPENIAVIVIGAGDVVLMLDEEEMKLPGIEKAIRRRLAGNPALIVWIRTTDEARYIDFVRVLEEVKKAGAMRILINEGRMPLRGSLKP